MPVARRLRPLPPTGRAPTAAASPRPDGTGSRRPCPDPRGREGTGTAARAFEAGATTASRLSFSLARVLAAGSSRPEHLCDGGRQAAPPGTLERQLPATGRGDAVVLR